MSILIVHSVCFLASICTVHSWGHRGHQAIARLAYRHMNDHTKEYVSKVIGHRVSLDEFVTMSNWADLVSRQESYSWSRCFHYTRNSECLSNPDYVVRGNCLLTSVQKFASVLIAGNESSLKTLPVNVTQDEALKFVIHLVGDLHAPFHIGDDEDKNGCDVSVNIQPSTVEKIRRWRESQGQSPKKHEYRKEYPSTLHSVWDSTVIDFIESDAQRTLNCIIDGEDCTIPWRIMKNRVSPTPKLSFKDVVYSAARKSRQVLAEVGLPDERGEKIKSGDTLSHAYLKISSPYAVRRLVDGGHNLALILNRVAELSNV
jgi:hypothetical protein